MLCIVFGFLFSVFFALKGYSKIKIYSTFTHPCVGQTLYDLISSVEHKRRYFWEMWEVFFFFLHTLEVNGLQCRLVPNVFIIFCVQQKKIPYRF